MLRETGIFRLRPPGRTLGSFIDAAAGDARDYGKRKGGDKSATRHAKTFARRRLSRIEAFRLTKRKAGLSQPICLEVPDFGTRGHREAMPRRRATPQNGPIPRDY